MADMGLWKKKKKKTLKKVKKQQPTAQHKEFGTLFNKDKVLGSFAVFIACGFAWAVHLQTMQDSATPASFPCPYVFNFVWNTSINSVALPILPINISAQAATITNQSLYIASVYEYVLEKTFVRVKGDFSGVNVPSLICNWEVFISWKKKQGDLDCNFRSCWAWTSEKQVFSGPLKIGTQ